jgi:hypothetical protein
MSAWSNTDNQAGKPVVEATTWVIDASSTDVVDTSADTIVVSNGFETGDALIYTSGGTEIGGLTSGTTYYAIRVGGNTIQLAASASDATAGTEINLTAVGSETDDTLQALAGDLYGVDKNEMAANKTQEGAAHAGWNRVTTRGSRKIVETLVAMSKNAFSATDAEDVVFEDYLITIDTQPAAASVTSPADVVFTVAASITGTGGTLTYQWQVSTDGGSTWANTVDASGTAATLTVISTDAEYVTANEFRCIVSATGADSVTSDAVAATIA